MYGIHLILKSDGKQLFFIFETEEQLYPWIKYLRKALKVTDKYFSYHIFSKFDGLTNGYNDKIYK